MATFSSLVMLINWTATGQLATTLMSSVALILSLLTFFRGKKKIKVRFDISERDRDNAHSVSVSNAGNHAFTIHRVALVMVGCAWEETETVLYDLADPQLQKRTMLQAGDSQTFEHKGRTWWLFDEIEVILSDGSVHRHDLGHNARLGREWFDLVSDHLRQRGVTSRRFPVTVQMVGESQYGFSWDLLEPICSIGPIIFDCMDIGRFGLEDLASRWALAAPEVLETRPGWMEELGPSSVDLCWTTLAYEAATNAERLAALRTRLIIADHDQNDR